MPFLENLRFGRLVVEAHRNCLQAGEVYGNVKDEIERLAWIGIADEELCLDEKFIAYSEELKRSIELSQASNLSEDDEIQLLKFVLPMAVVDGDSRCSELYSRALDGAKPRKLLRTLPFEKFVELKDHTSKCSRSFTDWLQHHFKYIEGHEESNGFVRFWKLGHFLKPVLKRLDGVDKAKGDLIKQVLTEGSATLCASHICSTIVMMLGIRDCERIFPFYEKAGWWREENNKDYLDRAKAVTTALRTGNAPADFGKVSGSDVAAWSYIEYSTGRACNRFDLEKEMKNRSTKTVPLSMQTILGTFTERIHRTTYEDELAGLVSSIPLPSQPAVTFERQFMERGMWSSEGAGTREGLKAPMLYEQLQQGGKRLYEHARRQVETDLKKAGEENSSSAHAEVQSRHGLKRQRLNKRAGMEYVTFKQFVSECDPTTAELVLRLIDKFENAKGRLILNGDDNNYIAGQLIVADFEHQVQQAQWAGHATRTMQAMSQIQALMSRINGGMWMLSGDWSDFNIHQDCEHMASSFVEIGKWVQNYRGGHPVEFEVCDRLTKFLTAACYNSVSEQGRVHLMQGLPSGIRATDLFNTLSNRLFCIISDIMIRECGIIPMGIIEGIEEKAACKVKLAKPELDVGKPDCNSLHIGDDLLGWTARLYKAVLRLYGLVAMGCRMNAFKQQISKNKCEWLRRWITATSVSAFPMRALGNLLSPPLQAKDIPQPAGTVGAWLDEITECGRRRLDDACMSCLYAWAEHRAASSAFAIPRHYLYSAQMDNGLGYLQCDSMFRSQVPISSITIPELPRPREHPMHDQVGCPKHAINDLMKLAEWNFSRFPLEQLGIERSRIADDMYKVVAHSTMDEGKRREFMRQVLHEDDEAWSFCKNSKVLLQNNRTIIMQGSIPGRGSLGAYEQLLAQAITQEHEWARYLKSMSSDFRLAMQITNLPGSRQMGILRDCIRRGALEAYHDHHAWCEEIVEGLEVAVRTGNMTPGMISAEVQLFYQVTGGRSMLSMWSIGRAMKLTPEDAICVMVMLAVSMPEPKDPGSGGVITAARTLHIFRILENFKLWQTFQHFIGPSMLTTCYAIVASRLVTVCENQDMASLAGKKYAADEGASLGLALSYRLALSAVLTEVAFQ